MVIVREDLDSRHAAEVTPQELERWLREHCNTAATANRCKAFISLCSREGVRNGKVSVNPARIVRQWKEGGGRLRFLSRDEYDKLHKVIAKRFPQHLGRVLMRAANGEPVETNSHQNSNQTKMAASDRGRQFAFNSFIFWCPEGDLYSEAPLIRLKLLIRLDARNAQNGRYTPFKYVLGTRL